MNSPHPDHPFAAAEPWRSYRSLVIFLGRESQLLIGFWVRTYGSAIDVAAGFWRGWVGEALPGVGSAGSRTQHVTGAAAVRAYGPAARAQNHFRISLPSPGRVTAMIGSMTQSVLVVDDDPEFRKLAGRLLAASGLTVIGEADSVAAALEAAVQLSPPRCW